MPEIPGGKFFAKVRLPPEFGATQITTKIMIVIDKTTANDAVDTILHKLKLHKKREIKDFVLKVVGQEEYIYGDKKIIDYEAVRAAVRSEDDVEFVFLEFPEDTRLKAIEVAREKQLKDKLNAYKLYPRQVAIHDYLDQYTMVNDETLVQHKIDLSSHKTSSHINRDEFKKPDSIEWEKESVNTKLKTLDIEHDVNILPLNELDWRFRIKVEL